MKKSINKVTIVIIVALMSILVFAVIVGCSTNTDPHIYCDCEEQIEKLKTENSELNERVDVLESQMSALMNGEQTTAGSATATTATTESTDIATSTTKTTTVQGGNKTTKTTGKTTAKPTTKATTKPTAAPTAKPTNGDGFGTDVGM